MGFPDAKWAVDQAVNQIVNKLGIAPNDMRKFEAKSFGATSIALKFLEPQDSLYSIGGAKANTVEGVIIRMGTDDYPSTPNDGVLVVDNKIIGRYENEPFLVNNLTQDATYYFSAFPYTTVGIYNESSSVANRAEAIPIPGEIVNVTVNIDDEDTAAEFTSAAISLHNLTDGTIETLNVSESGTYTFFVKGGDTFKITANDAGRYEVDETETEEFTAVANQTREVEFTYTYNPGELITVTITVDKPEEFTSTLVTLHNLTDETEIGKHLYTAGSVSFLADAEKLVKVTVTKPDNYRVNMPTTEEFITVAGGEKDFTFDFAYSTDFHLTIEFDNGLDGIPESFIYKDDCAGFTPASGPSLNSWEGHPILDYFRPCVIRSGASEPEYYLDKNNYNKKEDGTASVLTGADGDVMVEVGRLYYNVYIATDDRIGLTITNVKENGFFAFNDVAGEDVEYRYRGVYEAFVQNTQLRSISGVIPSSNITLAAFRSYAANRGPEYTLNDYSLVFLWQCMYILLYGSRDSQSALGMGRADVDSTGASNGVGSIVRTGTMNEYGFCWGDSGGINGVKFLGVEHFYGNLAEWVGGIKLFGTTSDAYFKVTRDPSVYESGSANSYEIGPFSAKIPNNAYIASVRGIKDAIFLPESVGGSSSTYFCDSLVKVSFSSTTTSSRAGVFGGNYELGFGGGAFCWDFTLTPASSDTGVGSRLCRRKVNNSLE